MFPVFKGLHAIEREEQSVKENYIWIERQIVKDAMKTANVDLL